MATVETNKSPIHIECTVGYPYGVQDSSYSCGFHTGTDFPRSRYSRSKPRYIFSCRKWDCSICI